MKKNDILRWMVTKVKFGTTDGECIKWKVGKGDNISFCKDPLLRKGACKV